MNLIDPRAATREPYDVVAIGSGFGTSFFLHGLLRSGAVGRVLVLEWGDHHPHAWQIEQRRNSAIDGATTVETPEGHKEWVFDTAWAAAPTVGGGRRGVSEIALHCRVDRLEMAAGSVTGVVSIHDGASSNLCRRPRHRSAARGTDAAAGTTFFEVADARREELVFVGFERVCGNPLARFG